MEDATIDSYLDRAERYLEAGETEIARKLIAKAHAGLLEQPGPIFKTDKIVAGEIRSDKIVASELTAAYLRRP